MDGYNYKVVAELKTDLSEKERISVVKEIKDLQSRLRIVNIDNVTYCKAQPIDGHDDFGAVAFFFSALKDMKWCFSRLEYHDLWGGQKACRSLIIRKLICGKMVWFHHLISLLMI